MFRLRTQNIDALLAAEERAFEKRVARRNNPDTHGTDGSDG
jgi:hypothetical protein